MPAPAETVAVEELSASRRRAELSGMSWEAVDLSSADASPTMLDVNGHALTPRALEIGVAGNIKIDGAGGGVGVTIPVQAGQWAGMVKKIYKTGTTATGLVFVY